MQLEVELAVPDGRAAGGDVLRLGLGEELRGPTDLHARRALQVGEAPRTTEHLAGGAATAVAVAEGDERVRRARLVAEVRRRVVQLGRRDLRGVRVDGREVREDPRPVDALPGEAVVREGVGVVPGDLLGEEPAEPRTAGDLGQGAGVAEAVGQPHPVGLHAQLLREVARAVGELPDDRLARGHHGVGLDPHAADGDEPALADALQDAREELGLVLLEPRELLRGGHRVDEVRVGVHEREDVGDRAGHLAPGLPQGPQPGGVDVRVADGGDAVRARVRRHGQDVRQRGTGGGGGGGVAVVVGVERALERVQEPPVARLVGGDLGGQPADDLEVAHELPDLGAELRHLGGAQHVGGEAGRRVLVADVGDLERREPEDEGVRRRLDVQREGAVLREEALGRSGAAQAEPAVARVQRLDERPVGPVDERLAVPADGVVLPAQVDAQLDDVRGVRGDAALDAEPGGAPRRAPRRPEGEGLVPGGLPAVQRGVADGMPGRDRLAVAVHLPRVQRDAVEALVDVGADALAEHAFETVEGQLGLGVHGSPVARPSELMPFSWGTLVRFGWASQRPRQRGRSGARRLRRRRGRCCRARPARGSAPGCRPASRRRGGPAGGRRRPSRNRACHGAGR